MSRFIAVTILALIHLKGFAYSEQGIPVINKTGSDITITYKKCSPYNNECSNTMTATIENGIDRNNFFEFNEPYVFITSITKDNEVWYFADRSNGAAVGQLAGGDEKVKFCTSSYGTALEIIAINQLDIKCIQRVS